MNITIDTATLNGAIRAVTKALSAHTTLSILEGIYIEAIGNEVLFRCTDLSLQIETIVNAEVSEEGGIVLPGRLFTDIAARMPGEQTTIKTQKNTASLKSGRAAFKVQGESIEEYHTMPKVKHESSITMPMELLKSMIGLCIFATAQDESKPILGGVLLELHEESLSMIALDGFRLAMTSCAIQNGTETTAVVPAKSLVEISRLLLDSEDTVTLTFSSTHIFVDMGSTKITTRLLAGEFIKYKQILPKDHTLRVSVARAELQQAIERAALVARENKSNIINFSFEKELLHISASSETGNASEDVPVMAMGEVIDIAFNAKYIMDVLKALPDEYVYMDFNNNVSPCVIRPIQGERYFYLLLPVRMFA